jgi:RNA polymerase sigma factor (TIGR02999 family)
VASDGSAPAESHAHFLRVAARAMRNVLIDHARARAAQKRGKRAQVEPEVFDLLVEEFAMQQLDVLALHEALERLAAFDEPLARMVELRYFAGLSVPEVAKAEGVSVSTVERSWRVARAWLRKEIPRPDGDETQPAS